MTAAFTGSSCSAWKAGELAMPITPFLEGENFDPETRRIMGVAFEAARSSLRLSDVSDRVAEIVAKKIIELAKAGERNPDLLCERALADLGQRPRLDQPPRRPAAQP
jgi:hypothetical protein